MSHHAKALNISQLMCRTMLITTLVITILFVFLACSQQPPSTTENKVTTTTTSETGAATMKVHRDPETGKLSAPPETADAPEPSEAKKRATSTSSEGLEEKPAPGGGTMVDLQGRFQSTGKAEPNEQAQPNEDKASKPTNTKQSTSQQKAYKDPETGKLGPPPEAADALESLEALRHVTSTSLEGLEEKPAPGGGTMVDLQGRFGSAIMATKDKNGNLTLSHVPKP
ncbi:MAG: hypothetical protein ETSY1_07445 [Candidatus Entotheonella factor]|uniref:Lipoprotein n=1 Tax=Entotheonella factor TaxID=1429438 RepID=W4LUQ5_ENTF1|nr:MAG: hypothetical protein ETSY1_07445 [Candidatus Entotheonella factor]